MRNPEYTFTLLARRNGADVASIQAQPTYAAGLSKEIARESGEQFFRSRLSGQLTFKAADYTFIVSQPFDTEFRLQIWCNMQAGVYWTGRFFKTDCEFNEDDRTVVVTPSTLDDYTDVLDGVEREFDLIKLTPEIAQVSFDRRPMLQIYVPGQTSIGCYLSGMWWEQECEAVTSDSALKNTYKFDEMVGSAQQTIQLTGDIPTGCPDLFVGVIPSTENFFFSAGGWTFQYEATGLNCRATLWEGPVFTGTIRFRSNWETKQNIPFSITLLGGGGRQIVAEVSQIKLYSRIICDVDSVGGVPTEGMPASDMVSDNRNYTRVFPYDGREVLVVFNVAFSSTPTEWGLYEPGEYYAMPEQIGPWFPVARKAWTQRSIWFNPSYGYEGIERQARATSILRDAYPISSVIAVLLGQIAPGVTHEGDTSYSDFLYGANNPITGEAGMRVFITPKSNVVNSQYDQPAQKAPITLREVLNMLRTCYQCYWWLDNGKLRIEHIAYFKGGGQYFGSPVVGIDLTALQVKRNGKSWAFARGQYSFDKPETVARYEFGWMDTETEPFDGAPIEVSSGFVEQGRVEEVRVDNFSADIDYILLNPADISNDGFVLLYAQENYFGVFELPYYRFTFRGIDTILQNGYASFAYLQQFYAYDMPAPDCEVDGAVFPVYGVKQLKRQSVTFPSWTDPDLLRLIKTEIGNGKIQSLSVNLCSRLCTATLSYDTE